MIITDYNVDVMFYSVCRVYSIHCILYYTIFYTILYYILYYTILYYTILYYTILYSILYYTIHCSPMYTYMCNVKPTMFSSM